MFDNIYIGHSVEDAEKLKKETYDVKIVAEKAEEEKSAPKADEIKSPSDLKFMDDPVLYVREKVELIIEIAKRDPLEAIRFVPDVAGGVGTILVLLVTIILSALGGSSKAPSKEQAKEQAKKAKAKAQDAKEQAAEALSTGAENAKAEVNKRTTRSSEK